MHTGSTVGHTWRLLKSILEINEISKFYPA